MPFFSTKDGEISLFYPRDPGGSLSPLQRASLHVVLEAEVRSHAGIFTRDGKQPTWEAILDWAILTDLLEEALLGKRGTLAARVLDQVPGCHSSEVRLDRVEIMRQFLTPGFMLAVFRMINAPQDDDQQRVEA